MPKFIDLTGKKFGLLTVLNRVDNDKGVTMWNCKCDCGTEKVVRAQPLVTGNTRSCGCLTKRADYTDPRFIDLTGQEFGYLTVLGYDHTGTNRQSYWKCKCVCGAEKVILGSSLKMGRTVSCGCMQPKIAAQVNTTHGMSCTALHRCWKNMIQRCGNPSNSHWDLYGGRGIRVCDRWLKSFADFASDMGAIPSESHSIDRIRVDGNYEPGNCRWATDAEQARNKRNTIQVKFGDTYKCLKDICDEHGISYFAAYHRIVRLNQNADEVIKALVSSKEPSP